MKQAADLYRAKNFEGALELYDKAVQQGIKQGDPILWRGMSHFNLGNGEKALEDLKAYLETDPNNADINNIVGLILYESGTGEESIFYYDKAIESNPRNAQAYLNRGIAWLSVAIDDNAIKDFNKAIELENNNAYAYYQRSIYYKQKNEYINSLADVNKALSLGLSNAEMYAHKGNVLSSSGKMENAAISYGKAINLDPSIEYLKKRSEIYKKLGKMDLAENDTKRISTILGSSATNKGKESYYKVNDIKEAFTLKIPDDWTAITKKDAGITRLNCIPKKYKSRPDESPIGIKFVFYNDLDKHYKGKSPKEIVESFEKETLYSGMGMHTYEIKQRKFKKYGGIDFMMFLIETQSRPTDPVNLLEKGITNLNDNILVFYAYGKKGEYQVMTDTFESVKESIEFTGKY
jgi:tetratricopeptide (TPR) repeat protein